jgi:tetratricopeptide (TPR) repeat protein
MANRFQQALPFYKKAEKLYGTIGDRVSYAYTLWSIGTTYKMLGDYSRAWSAFQKADGLFKKTGDNRGRIYSLLGFAEIEFLKNKRSKGLKYWRQAKTIADKSGYAWVRLHVEALKDGQVVNLTSRYKKAGSLFHPHSLPVNWP